MSKFLRVFAGSAAFAAVVLFSTSAHAGIIRGAWDPDWGPSYPNTRFDGFVEFFVPNACLPIGSSFIGNISDTDPCSAGGMSLINASATLYDKRGPGPGDDIALNTIVFAPPVQSPDPVLGVFVDWDGSNLLAAELRTDLIGPRSSGVAPSFAPANLFLKFSWGTGPGGETLDAGAYLSGCSFGEGDTCVEIDGLRSNRATVTYTAVPEPGSLFLLVSGIVAGWLVRRRAAAT